MKDIVMLIDGSSLIFRAFYAIRNLTTKDGIYTNGVYGFLNMFYKAMEQYNPTYVCVAFDRSSPTFRHKDYEAYKAQRQETPSELNSQFGILKDVLDAMHVKHLDVANYEADDICGTLARISKEEGKQAVLITGDRDYLQLVDEDVLVVLTKKGISDTVEYDVEKVQEEYGIKPKQLIDVKGLMGDKSDNIPGIPGIGEKTALGFIREFGSMDRLYENLDSIKSVKTKQKLEENRVIAYMSRKLGEIFLNAPIETDLEAYGLGEPDYEKLYDIYDRLEFNSFKAKLPVKSNEEIAPSTETECEVGHLNQLEKLAERIHRDGTLYYKFIYDGESYLEGEVLYFCVYLEDDSKAVIFDYRKDPAGYNKIIKSLFESTDLQKTSYDIKEDFVILMRNEIDPAGPFVDLMILEYLMDPIRSSYSISSCAKTYLEEDVASRADLLGKGKAKKNFSEINEESIRNYIANFLRVLPPLEKKLTDAIRERDMEGLCYGIELPLVKVLASMEFIGVPVDEKILDVLGEEFDENIKKDQEAIYGYAGYEFNINSTKQLGEVLFEKLGLPVIKKTKTGYSTDADVLERLKGKHEIVDCIMRYRGTSKLKSTYIDGLKDVIDKQGRIHSRFMQNVAATGRISSVDPNLQNIPVKTEEGRRIRKAFTASEGRCLLDADYSQIELRILAHLSGDEKMIQAFQEDLDIHTQTAAEVFHAPFEEVTSLQRSRAKAVNFGIVYGISDYGLSQNLNIPRGEAKDYIEKYLDTYPSIREYMDSIVVDAKKKGYVDTIFNRRRYIPELSSKNKNIRAFGERIALNTPIQGSAADIIKIAMVRVYDELKAKNLKSQLILQVHDELIVDVAAGEEDQVEAILFEIMEQASTLSVPLKVDMNWGENWYDAK